MKTSTAKYILLLFLISLLALVTDAQGRLRQSINTDWQFRKANAGSNEVWEHISIPHSWNTKDVTDDEPGYYRGLGIYRKTLFVPNSYKDKDVYLFFEGAAQVAAVYVNGQLAGTHTGSYTAFRVPVTTLLQYSGGSNKNEIEVRVDNSHSENIPPLSADFTFYGGIYRDVYLEAFDKIHFDADNNASAGIFITTPQVSSQKATVQVKGKLSNHTASFRKLNVISRVIDNAGTIVAQKQTALQLQAGADQSFDQQLDNIAKPHLWSIDAPYLYQVVTTITNLPDNQQLDEVANPLGFRWFRFTADSGFFLNGKNIKLFGASRHQDYPDMANALPDALNMRDVQLLKDMGANLLRVAHYPQDPSVLQACDRLGIITSVEIPIVNAITENDSFTANCLHMQTEMIRQNFNHPSVVIWAYMNEVLLRLRYTDDKPRQEVYFKNVKSLAQTIDNLTRKEDPSRYTMIPFHGAMDLYAHAGLTEVPQIIGWNQYSGWYGADINEFARNMDRHQREFKKPMIVTEFGADGDPRLRSFSPVRFDKTLEYETYFHKKYYNIIKNNHFIAAGMVWNLADFNAEARNEAMPHINNKGLLAFGRQPKDVYLYYQSRLWQKPFLKIGSRSWTLRSGIADGEGKKSCTQHVAIYTNQQAAVTLTDNGRMMGTKLPEDGVAGFDVPFTEGDNQLVATVQGSDVKDLADIRFLLQPYNLKDTAVPFRQLNVSLGDDRFFTDEQLQQVWLPEKPYTPGSWRYIGGEVFKLKDSRRQPYGSDKNILQTTLDPIYETQRSGIQQFKLDVPPGQYEITLHFAELLSAALRDANVYNLDNNHQSTEQPEERSFDILINGQKLIEGLGSGNYIIPEQAYSTKVMVTVADEQGITLEFKALQGHAILNGLQIIKI